MYYPIDTLRWILLIECLLEAYISFEVAQGLTISHLRTSLPARYLCEASSGDINCRYGAFRLYEVMDYVSKQIRKAVSIVHVVCWACFSLSRPSQCSHSARRKRKTSNVKLPDISSAWYSMRNSLLHRCIWFCTCRIVASCRRSWITPMTCSENGAKHLFLYRHPSLIAYTLPERYFQAK